MENSYQYFKRDLSWLSFNYRVLLEAEDDTLPIYERIKFLSIYSSNLEEFYEIRVAEHRGVIMKKNYSEESAAEAEETLAAITREVNRQQRDYYRIFSEKILPELNRQNVYLYQNEKPEPFHEEFVHNFFNEEVFPFLSPVMIQAGDIRTFIRDRRLYLVIRMIKRSKRMNEPGFVPEYHYALMKIPYAKVPRFIELPQHDGKYYIMFIDDIIRANLQNVFPGYIIDGCYSIKISRDADIYLDDESRANIVENIRKKVKKRKIGAVCRFVYDRKMPVDYLEFLVDAFDINRDELVPGDKHLNLEDLSHLPNPNRGNEAPVKPVPMKLNYLDEKESIFRYVNKRDLLLHFPYHSFDHFIHFLYEAVHDPSCKEIMITQYRVAENSEVINTLIAAAQNGKQVTVFVELKARFDEENNLATAELMEKAGIHIIYSIPGLKVHAKVALVLRRNKEGKQVRSYAYISTGNFNEKTATVYADSGLFTSNEVIVNDLHTLFRVLRKEVAEPKFKRLLVARFNLLPELRRRIGYEINMAKAGKEAHIILKMNALQDPAMIDELYKASEAGVKIDLIVRGICCLIPGQAYSKNIRITRIVDSFLEHARIWYFLNGGKPLLFMGSPDWMRRNLYRRIEAVTPVMDEELKQEMIDMLHIQLRDNQKAGWVDENLKNVLKKNPNEEPVRAQYAFYEYLKEKNDRNRL
mgnify:CR=1 FL=1